MNQSIRRSDYIGPPALKFLRISNSRFTKSTMTDIADFAAVTRSSSPPTAIIMT